MTDKDLIYAVSISATALVGVWNIINHYRLNKRTTFINTVTSERVKWLDKLRHNISSFCGLTHTWCMSELEGKPEEYELLAELDKLRYLIRLQLNPKIKNGKPNEDKIIEDLISEIPNLTHKSKEKELKLALEKLIVTSQALLKDEWEKVKRETKRGDLSEA